MRKCISVLCRANSTGISVHRGGRLQDLACFGGDGDDYPRRAGRHARIRRLNMGCFLERHRPGRDRRPPSIKLDAKGADRIAISADGLWRLHSRSCGLKCAGWNVPADAHGADRFR